MILVDGEKYSCVQCIRGHRSSTCKHSARPLVQVRSRGRPSLNAGHRIAVTESEVVLSRDQVTIQDSPINTPKPTKKKASPIPETIKETKKSSCCSSKPKSQHILQPSPTVKPSTSSCCGSSKPSFPHQNDENTGNSCCSTTHSECGCGKNGVIMLRASKRQFVDVKNGNIDYVGPYNESSLNKFKIGVTMNNQPPNKKSRHIRNSSCSSAASFSAANKLTVLKQIKMNEFDYQIPNNSNFNFPIPNNYPSHQLRIPDNHISRDHLAMGFPISLAPYPAPHQQQQPIIHPKPNFDQIFQEYHSEPNTTPPVATSSASSNPIDQYQIPQPLQPQPQEKIYDVVYSSGCADECNCGPGCNCPGCLIHRTNEELKEYGILDTTSTSSTPSEYNTKPSPVNYDLINLETIDEMLLRDMFEEECFCKTDECCCYNCSKHGISEGIRLSDGYRVAEADGELDFGRDNTPAQAMNAPLPVIQAQETGGSCCGGQSENTSFIKT